MQISDQIENCSSVYLDLEYQASEPYTQFVYQDANLARTVQRLLFESNTGEYAARHGRVLLIDGEAHGMFVGLTAHQLKNARLRASMMLAKSSVPGFDDRTRDRLQLAGTTLMSIEPSDFYLSRIGIVSVARSGGLGAMLLQACEDEAKRNQCARVALDVAAESAAVRFYERHGYAGVGQGQTEFEASKLHYLHMTKQLG